MICPICNRPTRRMVYKRTGKLCVDCNNPNFIRVMEFGFSKETEDAIAGVSRMHEWLFGYVPPGYKTYSIENCLNVITPQTQTLK
jgi:hypothetical protein